MNTARDQTTPPHGAPNEIVTTRIFAVPRETLFAAFADPKQLAQWWGPSGFRNTIHEFQLRPGGTWRSVLHGPDGAEYDNACEFVSVVPPAHIVLHHLGPAHPFTLTMDYEPMDLRQTRLTWRMSFDPATGTEDFRRFLQAANEQNFDRLAALLQNSPSQPG